MPATAHLAPVDAQRVATLAVIESLTPSDLGRVNARTGWTVGQILGHVAASELGCAFFVRRAGEGDLIQMDLASRDQFNDLQTEKAGAFDLDAIKTELSDSGEALRQVFEDLEETDLDKPIEWPEWPVRTIRDSIPYIVQHEAEHLADVRATIQDGAQVTG